MMKKHWLTLFFGITLIFSTACASDEQKLKTPKKGQEEQEKTAVTYTATTDISYANIKENIEMAITDQGLIISGTLHISDMLNRTGKDLGFDILARLDLETSAESLHKYFLPFWHLITRLSFLPH